MAKTKLTKTMIQDCYNWICVNGLMENGGAKFIDFCNAMGISDETYYNWEKGGYPLSLDFLDAVKQAKEVFRQTFANDLVVTLAKSAKGYTRKKAVKEMKPDKEGKPTLCKMTVTEEDVPPNVGAAIFLLTNLDPDNWQNKQNIVAKETKETKIKVDADAQLLNEIPADVIADIADSLQTALEQRRNEEYGIAEEIK